MNQVATVALLILAAGVLFMALITNRPAPESAPAPPIAATATANTAGTLPPQESRPNAAQQAILDRLANTRLTLAFEEVPLPLVLEFLSDVTGIDFVLDPLTAKHLAGSGELITLPLEDASIAGALQSLCDQHHLQMQFQDTALLFSRNPK